MVFPAHAGLFRPPRWTSGLRRAFPRARGVVPTDQVRANIDAKFSPRTRGCSHSVALTLQQVVLFPAHAGLFPGRAVRYGLSPAFPRARGVVPHLGRNLATDDRFFPRARGVVPPRDMPPAPQNKIFPAHAGLFPPAGTRAPKSHPFPAHAGLYPRHHGSGAGTARHTRHPRVYHVHMEIVDLFCGAGGMSRGFSNAGFEVAHGFDNWHHAVNTAAANADHPVSQLDLADVSETTAALTPLFDVDMQARPGLVGGPPCQDFSSAGKRVEAGRADLTEKFAGYVRDMQPSFVVMENVPAAAHAAAYQSALETMRQAGYAVDTIVINAELAGVPQARKRLFAIATRDEPTTQAIMDRLRDGLAKEPMTMRDYFGDSLGTEHVYRHPRSYSRRGIFSIDEPSPTIRGVNRPIPPGYPGHPGDSAPIDQARPLTTAERAKVQTFPDDYEFCGPTTAREQMIGNAVPVRLAEYVARAVADVLYR